MSYRDIVEIGLRVEMSEAQHGAIVGHQTNTGSFRRIMLKITLYLIIASLPYKPDTIVCYSSATVRIRAIFDTPYRKKAVEKVTARNSPSHFHYFRNYHFFSTLVISFTSQSSIHVVRTKSLGQ